MAASPLVNRCPYCNVGGKYRVYVLFGKVMVKHCRSCGRKERHSLPRVHKRIIYLDQCFYSSLYRKDDARITQVAKELHWLVDYQQVATPWSSIHEKETLQSPKERKRLLEVIKGWSFGKRLHLPHHVLGRQLHRSLQAFVQRSSYNTSIERSDAVPDDVDDWPGDMWVNIPMVYEDPDDVAALKAQYIEILVARFDAWRQMKLNYEELVAEECGELVKGLFGMFHAYQQAWSSKNPTAHLPAPAWGELVADLLRIDAGSTSGEDSIQRVQDFFLSDYFSHTPYVHICTGLYALLRRKIQEGQYTNVEKVKRAFSGLSQDIDSIATYAPYCDAMFVDATMYQWVRFNKLDVPKHYGVCFYSHENLSDMNLYLQGLRGSLPPEVTTAVREAYPRINYD